LSMFQQPRQGPNREQFVEAQKRAQQPQPIIKHKRDKSLLLTAPNNMIFELFNTIIKEIPSERLVEFITQNLREYLYLNWTDKTVYRLIRRLKREQALDVQAGLTTVPVIKFSTGVQTGRSPTTVIHVKRPPVTTLASLKSTVGGSPQSPQSQIPSSQIDAPTNQQTPQQTQPPAQSRKLQSKRSKTVPGSPPRPHLRSMTGPTKKGEPTAEETQGAQVNNQQRMNAANQVYEHIMWRVNSDNVTQVTSLLIKMALDDGYRKGKLKTEPYDDVAPCFEDWRGQKLIKLYTFGAAPPNDQKLVLSSTTQGDLTKWVANFIDGSEKRQKPDLIRILAATLRDKTKNCIFITNELLDAMRSLDTGALRCVFLVDRLERYEPITSMPNFTAQIEPLIAGGRLFVMSSLSCVEFVQDPNPENCC